MHDLLCLKNSVAIVTGASGGIGCTVASVLIEHGAFCLLHDVSPLISTLEKSVTESRAKFLQGDLCDDQTIDEIFDSARAIHRPVTILINCAGLYERWDFMSLPQLVLERTMRLNANGNYSALDK